MISKEIMKGFKQIKCNLPIKDCEECQKVIMELFKKCYLKGIKDTNELQNEQEKGK